MKHYPQFDVSIKMDSNDRATHQQKSSVACDVLGRCVWGSSATEAGPLRQIKMFF